MIKRSPSRNHRSRGIKVKHVLQIILLLGVCFWLIYQVKHSHDKKKEFDENDAKVSVGTQTAYQTPKLGRKDLHPGKDNINQNEKHEEEEEDENIIVEDEDKHEHNENEEEGALHESEEKEENKHGMRGEKEDEDEDENKSEEMDDERGGGDDEIDENDQEQSAVDPDHDEEFMDEEKEKEEEHDEKEDENSEGDEKDGSVKNHNSHEAREEHYKGDDASSAVTHDPHTTSTETETVSLENFDVNSEMNMKSENKPNRTQDSHKNQHNSNFNITEVELIGGTSSNATSGKETGSNSLSNAMNSSHLDNITTTYSDGQSEASNTPTGVIPGVSNNMTGTSADTLSGQKKIVIYSESNQAQNDTVNIAVTRGAQNGRTKGLEQGSNRVSEENLPGPNSTDPVKTETADLAAGESSNLEGGGESTRLVASNETETRETNKTQNISHVKENTDATKEEFKGDTQRDETSGSSSVKGTSDSVEHHDTDSSGSNILKDVAEVLTDLNTLPDIRKERHNGDAAATD